MWTTKKFLIWGKTYPEFSKTYYETVCTGAVDAETGRLVRIYPVTLRYMKEPFKAYDWIEVEAERNTSDFRPESFRIRQDTLKVVGHVDTKKKGDWPERRRWILGPKNVFASVEALQAAEAADHTSLGLIRPREIRRVYMRKKPDAERDEWDRQRAAALQQKELFVDAETETQDLQYMPVQYRACFRCDDPDCKTEHDLSILDWGVYVLSRREYAARGPAMAEQKVIEKIEELLDPSKRDPFLFLGNTKGHSQSFMIVGLFHPPIEPAPKVAEPPRQGSLF
ncbi:MAG: hypothetical protein KF718_10100 [Polyangiaceae bacterium]|nr:hypothetical protein [Polyangiaceae bacterium]